MSEETPKSYPLCFGCGQANPIGLRLQYRHEGETLVTEFVPKDVHQGWPDIVHGGIIATLLYEVMENYPFHHGLTAMMKGMETKFRRPGKTGRKIVAKSWLVEHSGRDMKVAASLNTEDNDELIAEGNADMVVLNQRQIDRLGIA